MCVIIHNWTYFDWEGNILKEDYDDAWTRLCEKCGKVEFKIKYIDQEGGITGARWDIPEVIECEAM